MTTQALMCARSFGPKWREAIFFGFFQAVTTKRTILMGIDAFDATMFTINLKEGKVKIVSINHAIA